MHKSLLFLSIFLLASCTLNGISGSSNNQDTSNVDYYPDDQLLVAGNLQFKDHNYGKANSLFKKALDVAPNDPVALLGYAASSDMLRRFDLADLAYKKLQPIIGNRIEYHNNYGYSQLLRGNLQAARRHFIVAYEIDPANETAANNLQLLRNSSSYQKRSPGDLKGI